MVSDFARAILNIPQKAHAIDPIWGKPLAVTGKVLRLTDGAFQYTGGILGGTGATMGTSAVVEIGPVRVLIMTYATHEWADEQYRSAGLDAAQVKFVGVKTMMNSVTRTAIR
jgi:microcystin degradation protein MlrC